VGSIWTVVVMAAVIALIAIVRGHFKASTLLALVVLVLVGALWPPVAVLIGGVALVWLAFTQTIPLLRQLGLAK
jgi:hypothetical protein